MLMGDLNTLSPLDRREHEAQALVRVINEGKYAGALAAKFLDSRREAVDYGPMQALLEAPLHDVAASSGTRAAGREGGAGGGGGESVPTSINADKMHFTKLRLDYCLVNDALLDSCGGQRGRVRASVLRDRGSSEMSDHFPLEVLFEA